MLSFCPLNYGKIFLNFHTFSSLFQLIIHQCNRFFNIYTFYYPKSVTLADKTNHAFKQEITNCNTIQKLKVYLLFLRYLGRYHHKKICKNNVVARFFSSLSYNYCIKYLMLCIGPLNDDWNTAILLFLLFPWNQQPPLEKSPAKNE